ncbi:DNA polymerase I A, chloroplastic/mitochondrial-like isoform X2 [Impatiens glandulifera]|uniref:DNA polymerase I A, chloroplastic/mitochondrial-like isoform X2 n=1 Tax=Impatiens glandulifera TaxID=253017 RepID=UPI001FB0DEA9|nr:DNA polymerase I A, chloroplastic/mitochondrial-like isoform X2 [Impatiens glandulifera]
MTMGVSPQIGPFKPCRSTLFFATSRSCATSSIFHRPLSANSEPSLHRLGDHAISIGRWKQSNNAPGTTGTNYRLDILDTKSSSVARMVLTGKETSTGQRRFPGGCTSYSPQEIWVEKTVALRKEKQNSDYWRNIKQHDKETITKPRNLNHSASSQQQPHSASNYRFDATHICQVAQTLQTCTDLETHLLPTVEHEEVEFTKIEEVEFTKKEALCAFNENDREQLLSRQRLLNHYDKVLVVNNISMADEVVNMLTNDYKDHVFACDTEVANIDVKQETPVNHGEVTCFSIYCEPKVDFGGGKTCIWVDILDGGGKELLDIFAPFFEDQSIKKVWHNYSFDKHIIENYGIKVNGFHADTMHMARLWDSSRQTEGGYSLEALSREIKLFGVRDNQNSKVSMKTLFGRKKMKKDGSEGKIVVIPPVEDLQREDRKAWICYSALDSISTLELYYILRRELSCKEWKVNGVREGTMLDFYEKYWRPFGQLLVELETEGMLVDRAYLAKIEAIAIKEQQIAADMFRNWASKYCPDAKYMNVGSDSQLRQLFFGDAQNSKNQNEYGEKEKDFKVPNVDKVIEEGKKVPKKFRTIKLQRIAEKEIKTEMYTASGWPSVSGDALMGLAGKISSEFDFSEFDDEADNSSSKTDEDISSYGTAYNAFGGGVEGKKACHAIAALCKVCSIDSLISNFILPLQGSHISGKNGRVHCSLNINTETGRLSARRPNLQNQPALEKDRYKIRQAFIAAPGNSLIVADYGQLELRILAHLADCKSMLEAFKAGGDFHSRTAMNMYSHISEAVEKEQVLLEWHPQPGEDKPPVPLLKDAFGSERRKAKMLNFSIAYGKTPMGLARDWKVSVKEAKETVQRWYRDRKEVLKWQEKRKAEALEHGCVHTLLGRARRFPSMVNASYSHKGHIERAAINTPVQGSAADVAMCAMLKISTNERLKELGWKLLLQVHDEVILEGPTESSEEAKAIVVDCMAHPFNGGFSLKVDLSVDAKCAQSWYAAK